MINSRQQNLVFRVLASLFILTHWINPSFADQRPALSEEDREELRSLRVRIPPKILKLLARERRPLPHDFLKALGGTLPKAPPSYLRRYQDNSMANFNQTIPQLIAALERLWPNGKYVSLGRDAVITTDILDAFYRMLGQTDRTGRIDASGASIRPRNRYIGPSIVNPFLKRTVGLDLKQLSKGRPIVMMDRTSFGPKSQSRMILRGLYEQAALSRKSLVDLPTQLSFASLDPEYEGLNPQELERFMMEQRAELSKGSSVFSQIPTLTGYTDFSEWHGTWSTFQKQKDGTYTTSPGFQGEVSNKLKVLADFYEILSRLQSREFKKALHQAFQAFHVQFDPTGDLESRALRKKNQEILIGETQKRKAAVEDELRERIKDFLESLLSLKQQNKTEEATRVFFLRFGDYFNDKYASNSDEKFFYEDSHEKLAAMLFEEAVNRFLKGKLPGERLGPILEECYSTIQNYSASPESRDRAFKKVKDALRQKEILPAIQNFTQDPVRIEFIKNQLFKKGHR